MKCWYWRQGCTFTGTEAEVDDHVDYMIRVHDDEHKVGRDEERKKIPPVTTKCKGRVRVRFDKISEEIYLVCDSCGWTAVGLGYEPTVPDLVFAWEKHSTMRRKVQDDGGPREVAD